MFTKVTNSAGSTIPINVSQIVRLDSDVMSLSDSSKIVLSDQSLKEIYAIMFPVKKTANTTEADSELNELFDNLHKLVGGKGKAVFTLKREKQLKELLTKHRMTRENLTTAAINIKNDAFLQGDNDSKKRYGDIDYLLRPDKAAKWSEEQNQKKKESMF